MEPLRKYWKLICVNLALTAVLAEAAGLVYILVQEGRFHYLTPPERSETQFDKIDATRAHPYFGFISGADNVFSPNDVLIGIFGGSVAKGFAYHEMIHHDLARRLQESAQFRGRNIVILDYAHQTYKQPQQLNVLAYYMARGQAFDIVLNLDGFNEVAFLRNHLDRGVAGPMPAEFIMTPLAQLTSKSPSLEGMRDIAEIIECKQEYRLHNARAQGRSTAAGYVWDHLQTRRFLSRKNELESRLGQRETTPLIQLDRTETNATLQSEVRELVGVWRECSRFMDALARANGARYFEFIQPNQYWDTGRPMSEGESRVALNPDSSFIPGVELGYPLLLEEAASLRRQGVASFSAAEVFDNATEAMYIDNCCHFNALGNKLLADFMADAIVGAWDKPAEAPEEATATVLGRTREGN